MDEKLIRRIVEKIVAEMIEGRVSSASPPAVDPEVAKGVVPLGVSVRHAHLSKEHIERLFGSGHQLTPHRDLLQKGEYAASETVSLVGPKMRALENVRVLGPARGNSQVEISLTDAVYLGIRPPVRPSGNHEGTPGILIVGPAGFVNLESGVIRANRHIHLSAADAEVLGLRDNALVLVRVRGDRPLIYYDVQVRVHETFVAQMHLDTDDANAAGLRDGDKVQIILCENDCRICDTIRK
ncbi:MAG TPA: phosphate propanoyltransferase [Candidatus Sumerlaeia bacterium]|nr:phosphate propanoyltransferase [Candidatus Sumerlaeia bacterium]